VQDTTFLNYGTLRPKQGMGTVKDKLREEYLLHLTVAFTPERVNLGRATDVAAAGRAGGA
jgi:hypothetical protein